MALRILASLVLLAVLAWQLRGFDFSELLPELSVTTGLWLLASIGMLLVAFALQTLRWDAVLVPMGYHVPFPHLFSEFLAGQFVSNVLPTAFAGDIIRIARLGRDIDSRSSAFASIAIERLTGWFVLPAISLVTILLVPEFRDLGGATVAALAIDVGTMVCLGVVLAAASNRRWDKSANDATGWRRWIAAVHLGINAIRSHPGGAFWIIGAGIAFQVTQCLSIWMAARALEIDEVTVLAAFAFFPPTLIGQNLPVGFGGLGVREGAFLLFFGALGATDERVIALGLITYAVTMIASVVGAPFLAVGGQKWRDAIREAEREAVEVPLDTPFDHPEVAPSEAVTPASAGDTSSGGSGT
ncbi:MAG TPA: lysylphosphatidylglycerol synthase transmembrane domain-containing protein [Microthrixaceae bacterium]|nr:lysylphosphatidylglycerol synthase transmembrane domain-containing protein [Microthrixaceae bacterium]